MGGFTIYDVQAAEYNRSRRELPRVIAGALRLLWAAGRRQLLTILVVEALAAAGVAAAVLLGREVLAGVLEADRRWACSRSSHPPCSPAAARTPTTASRSP